VHEYVKRNVNPLESTTDLAGQTKDSSPSNGKRR